MKFTTHAFMTRLPRGRKARRLALRELEESWHFQWVLFRVVMICFVLWTLIHFQLLIAFFYLGPVPPVISGVMMLDPNAGYFMPVDGSWTSLSLAWRWMLLSGLGAGLGVGVVWVMTRGVFARWRMRFAVCLFAAFPVGYAGLNVASESVAWDAIEAKREYHAEQIRRYVGDARDARMHAWYVEWYDAMLEKRRR